MFDPTLLIDPDNIILVWNKLIWPLTRLIIFISVGLFVATMIESLNWTSKVAAVAKPLIKFGNFSNTAGASFSMALFSGISANTMLAEAYEKKSMQKKELILANLFNSLPTYFLHLPTIFFITAPLIKGAAVIYISLTFGAAILRTFSIVFISRIILPPCCKTSNQAHISTAKHKAMTFNEAVDKSLKRFKKRIRKIIKFTIPIFVIIFFMQQFGIFNRIEEFMATYLSFLTWLSPQSMGIITLHIAAEFTAGLAMAGAFLQDGSMEYREIILALLVGNILSSPLRAIRHQFPYYAGIFKPSLASELIFYNQVFRIVSLIVVGIIYFLGS